MGRSKLAHLSVRASALAIECTAAPKSNNNQQCAATKRVPSQQKGSDMAYTFKKRLLTVPIMIVLIASLAGFTRTPRLDDARFTVTSVTVPTGPASIANDASAQYTFTVTINRNQQGLLDGTNSVPAIRPGLYVGNRRLTFVEIDFPAGVSTSTVTLTLSCENNEVTGSENGSGHGARAGSGFLGWPWFGDDPARVSAKLNEIESDGTRDVLCGTG